MNGGLVLALLSSIAYGAADFAGGTAARGAHVLRVLVISTPASLLVALIAWPIAGARFSASVVWWSSASGVATAAAFGLLYFTLAVGPMSVLSPITAVISAVVPASVALLTGERLSTLAVAGLLLALVAVVVVSSGGDAVHQRPSRRAVLLAFAAGSAIAVQLICFNQAAHTSGDAPLLINRAVAAAVIMVVAGSRRGQLGERRPDRFASSAAGTLVALASLAFLFAIHHGALAIVAVITALYPAATVLLARLFLAERVTGRQVGGLAVAAVAVALLAVA